jgi:hypothetical protein
MVPMLVDCIGDTLSVYLKVLENKERHGTVLARIMY